MGHDNAQDDQIHVRFNRFWLLVVIVLIGAFLRLHELAAVPPSAGFDVAYYGLDALGILQGRFPIYFESNYGREPMFSYLIAALFAAIGLSDFAIHLGAAYVGILTIPVTFVVADELLRLSDSRLFRCYGPILAATILAVMYWHIAWSHSAGRPALIVPDPRSGRSAKDSGPKIEDGPRCSTSLRGGGCLR